MDCYLVMQNLMIVVYGGNNFYNNIGDSSSGWNCGENFENCDEADCEGGYH